MSSKKFKWGLRLAGILYFFLVCSFVQAREAQSTLRKWTVEDGLLDHKIQALLQDGKGFLWVGTVYGLNRFDGNEFVHVSLHEDPSVVPEVRHLSEDQEGRIWVMSKMGSRNYLQWIDPLSQEVHDLSEGDFEIPFDPNEVSQIMSTLENELWIVKAKKEIYRLKDQTFEQFYTHTAKAPIIQVYPHIPERVWIRTEEEIMETDRGGQVLTRLNNPTPYISTFSGQTTSSQLLWSSLNEKREIELFLLESGAEEPDPATFDRFFRGMSSTVEPKLLQQQNLFSGSWWIFDEGNITIYDERAEPLHFELGLPDQALSAAPPLLFVSDRSAWFSLSDGLYYFEFNPSPFRTLLTASTSGVPFSLRQIAVNDSGVILVNGNQGIWEIEPGTRVAKSISQNPTYQENFTLNSIYPRGSGLWLDSDGTLWGAAFPKLIRYSGQHKHCFPIDHGSIMQIYRHPEDPQNRLWLVTEKGLATFYPESERKEVIALKEIDNATLTFLTKANKQGIWVGTDRGLYQYRFRKETPELEFIPMNWEGTSPEGHLALNGLSHIFQENEKNWWLSTKGNGVYHWHTEKGLLKHYTKADGLLNEVIYAIYGDQHGNLWMTSNYGLIRLHPQQNSLTTFLPKDGIPNLEFNTYSHYQDTKGNLYFGGLNGLTVFHPDSLEKREKATPAQFLLTQISTQNPKSGRFENRTSLYNESGKIHLSHNTKATRIKFAYLDYSQQHSLSWKIEGYSDHWQYVSGSEMLLNQLPGGRYVLRVKVTGLQTDQLPELEIPLIVSSPMYAKIWFWSLVISVVILVVLFFWIRRRSQHQKERQMLQKMVEERTQVIQQQTEELKELDELKSKFFANISHELRTPLTLIKGPLALLLQDESQAPRNLKRLTQIDKSSEELLTRIDEILNLQQLEKQSLILQEEPTHFASWFTDVVLPFEWKAKAKPLDWLTPSSLPELNLLLDREKGQTILQNLLSNAIKFTPENQSIAIEVARQKEQLVIRVRDTGPGIPASEHSKIFERFYRAENVPNLPGTGIGLALSAELAQLMGGRIEVKSKFEQGSEFDWYLPIRPTSTVLPSDSKTAPTAPLSTLAPASPPKDASQLLIVEDNPELGEFLVDLLSPFYAIQLVPNGQEALKTLETNLPDLILTDLMMPVMDGYELLNHLKSHDQWQKIPVLILTARTGKEARIKALRIGVDDFLTKPFDPEELRIRLEYLDRNAKERKSWLAASPEPEEASSESNQSEQKWLEKLETHIRSQITIIDVPTLARSQAMSERQLLRRLKTLTGLSTSAYIKEVKLQVARETLESGDKTSIDRLAKELGFSSGKYFARIYKERFNQSPSEY